MTISGLGSASTLAHSSQRTPLAEYTGLTNCSTYSLPPSCGARIIQYRLPPNPYPPQATTISGLPPTGETWNPPSPMPVPNAEYCQSALATEDSHETTPSPPIVPPAATHARRWASSAVASYSIAAPPGWRTGAP